MESATQIVIMTAKRREEMFVKLRAATPYPLTEIARLLGLSFQEARNLDRRLREEVLLEAAMVELKNTLKNGY